MMMLPSDATLLGVVAAGALSTGVGMLLWASDDTQPGASALADARRFSRLVRGETGGEADGLDADADGLLVRIGRLPVAQAIAGLDDEIAILIRQSGSKGKSALARFAGVQILTIASALSVGTLFAMTIGSSAVGGVSILFVCFAAAFLAPKQHLRRRAKQRAQRIVDELPDFAQLLRILFDSGLSTEQALDVLTSANCGAVEAVNQEVSELLRRLGAGSNLVEATRQIDAELGIKELAELFALLRQIQRHGGAVEKPFANFIELLVDRQRTQVQERVNRISAQMTVVMVTCLLPALLAFLAGPGFLAIISALGETNG